MPDALRPLLAAREARVAELQEQAEARAFTLGHRLHPSWFYPRAVWLPVSVTFCTACRLCAVVDDGVEEGLRLRGGACRLGCVGEEEDG